jgi:hypothetical protein
MATQTIRPAEVGGRFRLTTLVTMATFIGDLLQLLRGKLNSVAVTRARLEENNVMRSATGNAPGREPISDLTNANDPSLEEILEIARIAQEVQTVDESYEKSQRRVIDSREFYKDELKIVRQRT